MTNADNDPRHLSDVLSQFVPPEPIHVPDKEKRRDTEKERITSLHLRGIPRLYWSASIKDFSPAVRSKIPRRPSNIFIYGANGVGKSHLAAALAIDWSGNWVSTIRLLLRVKRSYTKMAEESELGIVDNLAEYPLLVLDDMLAVQRTPHGMVTVLAILNERIERSLPTIVTCADPIQKVDAYDSNIASRLGSFTLLKLTGPDRRLQK